MDTKAGIVFILAACVVAVTAYPEIACTGPNEVETKCMSLCPQFCNISFVKFECKDKCEPGCDCKKNYLRDLEGKCVYYDQCDGLLAAKALECEETEDLVPCNEACPDALCRYLPMFEYVCTTLKEKSSGESNDEKKYKCPIAFDPNNIPSVLVSSMESTVVGVNYPHPTKYKRPEILIFSSGATYLAPFLRKPEVEEENDLVIED